MKVLLKLTIVMALLVAVCWNAAIAQVVDNSSITNKVICGYQGWFSCPGDGSGRWIHWANDSSWIGPGNYHTDIWPDTREYNSADLFVVPNTTLTQGGTPVLFSSHKQGAVNVHFRWMQENGIDGVFVQRFLVGCPRSQASDDVLVNVMNACATYGRVFAIEYDMSGVPDNEIYSRITQDWSNLKSYFDIKNNSRYLHHNGQVIVGLWGMFSERGPASTYDSVINWLHNDGCKVMGGGPVYWRSEGGDWYNTYRSLDIIQPWTVGAYGSSWADVSSYKNNYVVPDLAECNSRGITFMPVAWPKFRWDNMHNTPCDQDLGIGPRGGQHLWDQVYAYKSAGVTCQKIAMFDEYDESTAIAKYTDNFPTSGCWWPTEGKGGDWYLRLANQASRMQKGQISVSQTIPINSATSPDNTQMISNTIPTTMTVGQQYSVSVTVKNTGETTWVDGNWWKLGAAGDSDPFFAGTRVNLPAGVVVLPNQNYTFNFTMTAPTTTGTYTTDWQMVHEGIRWFGGILTKQVQVVGPTNNAQHISDTIPTTMTAGQQYTVSVTMKNTGGTTWSADGTNAYKLGGVGDSDPFYTVNNPPRILMNPGETVAPNAQRTFTFTMTAPSTPGTYTTDWRMVREWIEWFGGTLTKQVQVTPAPPVTFSTSSFDADANGWAISLWHSGQYTDGTMAWNSGAGRTGGGIRTIGSGASDNTDRCTREGGEIQKTISTVGYSAISVAYDLRVNTLGGNYTGNGGGTCAVDHNLIDEQLTVYYSTNGGTNWTEAEYLTRSSLLGYTSYGTRAINLAGVSACNNNANFKLRFRWQVNGTSDTVDLDNIKVTGTP